MRDMLAVVGSAASWESRQVGLDEAIELDEVYWTRGTRQGSMKARYWRRLRRGGGKQSRRVSKYEDFAMT